MSVYSPSAWNTIALSSQTLTSPTNGGYLLTVCSGQTVHIHRWESSRFIRISGFLICQIFFPGYGHISHSLNVIKYIFWIFLVRPFSSMHIIEVCDQNSIFQPLLGINAEVYKTIFIWKYIKHYLSVYLVNKQKHCSRHIICFFPGKLMMSDDWPDHGNIDFNDVSLAYDADLEPVLNHATFSISGGEKVMLAFTWVSV